MFMYIGDFAGRYPYAWHSWNADHNSISWDDSLGIGYDGRDLTYNQASSRFIDARPTSSNLVGGEQLYVCPSATRNPSGEFPNLNYWSDRIHMRSYIMNNGGRAWFGGVLRPRGIAGWKNPLDDMPSWSDAQVPEPSNTILLTEVVAETPAFSVRTAQLGNIGGIAYHPFSQTDSYTNAPHHDRRFNYAFCDGHIELLDPLDTVGTGGSHVRSGQQFTASILSVPHVFNVLLSAYLETQDALYLHKWCELLDERYMRLRGDMQAAYTREEPRKTALPLERAQTQGLDYAYYEEGYWPISALILDTLEPVKTGGACDPFDMSAKNTDGGYAFVYTGFLKIDQPGIYSFHSPRELIYPPVNAGYQLRLFIGDQEWYPSTRRHNYGVWSVPLEAGLHALRVVFVDQRNARMSTYRGKDNDWMWMGDKPELKISGPDLVPQPIPADMLYGGKLPKPQLTQAVQGKIDTGTLLPKLEKAKVNQPLIDGSFILDSQAVALMTGGPVEPAHYDPYGKDVPLGMRVESSGTLSHWGSKNEFPAWVIDVPEAGRYKVTLELSMGDSDSQFAVCIGDKELSATAKDTGGWGVFTSLELGEIDIPAGRHAVIVHARKKNKYLMNLNTLTLTPVQ